MKIKKFLLPSIFLTLTIIVYLIASVLFCYTTEPEIREGEFPFSVTYKYKGEIGILSGVYKCRYSGSDTIFNEHRRCWDGEVIIEHDGEYDTPNVVYRDETMTLAVFENMSAGYFMGDPLYADWYDDYGLEDPQPYIEYYDYVNDVSLNEENQDEIIEAIDFEIIDYTYAEPVENRFSFSGIMYKADNIIIFVVISLLFLIACLAFVRKDEKYQYSKFDKVGVVLNFFVGIIAVPLITLFCFFFGIVEGDVELINQIIYNVPPVSILCLTLSVVLRRSGVRKTGFFIQFGGVILFVAMLVLEAVLAV